MKLLTSSAVAAICEVDTKTVHNWINSGLLVGDRTPGRHLRLHRGDLVTFLRRHGYPVPRGLSDGLPHVIVAGSAEFVLEVCAADERQAATPELQIAQAQDPYDVLIVTGSVGGAHVLLGDVPSGFAWAPALAAVHRACPAAILATVGERVEAFPGYVRAFDNVTAFVAALRAGTTSVARIAT